MRGKKKSPGVALVVIDHQYDFCVPGGPVTPNTDKDILRLRRFLNQFIADHTIVPLTDLDPDRDPPLIWPDHFNSTYHPD